MLRSFILIVTIMFAFESAIFIARGILGLSPQMIAELASTYWGSNSSIVKNLAQQRADTLIGVAFLFMAFVFQMTLAFLPTMIGDLDLHVGAAIYAVVFSLVIGFGAYYLAADMATRHAAKAQQILDAPRPAQPDTSKKSAE